MKTKIPSLSYNAMFKAVFSNNKSILLKLVKAIFDYYNINLDISDRELIIKNNELPLDNYNDRELICDYIIKIDDYNEINIEINRSKYVGLISRNMTYSFKIFYEHFKVGDSYDEFSKYTLLQVNFNNFSNPNKRNINRYYMIDIDDLNNKLSSNFSIMNIDIASCYKLVYNSDKLKEISFLERWAGIIGSEYVEDISLIMGSDMVSMKEKEKFINDIKEKSKDKDVLEALKLENTVEDRFKWIENIAKSEGYDLGYEEGHNLGYKDGHREGVEFGIEQGIEQGIEKGIEKNTSDIIKAMIDNNISYEKISKITNKSIDEIKKIIG